VTQFQRLHGSVGCREGCFSYCATRVRAIVSRCVGVTLALVCALVPAAGVRAATFAVDTLEDRADAVAADGVCADSAGLCTLRAAITEANASPANDAILFAVRGTIVLGSMLPVVANAATAGTLEIDGGGQVTLSGNGRVPILAVASGGNLWLRNIRLERGSAYVGGAIYSYEGTLTIENSTFSGNSAWRGGGAILSDLGTLTIENCTFSGNSAEKGGAIHSYLGTLTIENCTFSGNSAEWGGAIYDHGTLTIVENSTLSGNSASLNGGAIALVESSMSRAVGTRLLDNEAAGDGGGVYVYGGTVHIRDTTLARNTSRRRGGGVFNAESRAS
jgi:CSLREA domain-containing protein